MNYLMNKYLEFFIRKYVQNNVQYGEKSKIDNYIHSIIKVKIFVLVKCT